MINSKSVTIPLLDKALQDEITNSNQKVENIEDKEAHYAFLAENKFNEQRNQILLESLKNENDTRKFLTDDLFRIIKIWFIFIGIVIILSAINVELVRRFPYILIKSFTLSDSIMITLLGSTTLTIVGLYSPVISHFFYKGKK